MGRFNTDPKRNAPTVNQTNPAHIPQNTYDNSNSIISQPSVLQQAPEWPTEFPKHAIIIDLEGVIVEPRNFMIKSVSDLEYNIKNIQSLKKLRMNGHKISLFAGFPEISRGNMSPQDGEKLINNIMKIFGQNGIMTIDHTLFSGSDLKDDEFAIPNPGMLRKLKHELKYDLNNGMYVGDNIKVLRAAEKFEIKPVLLKSSRFEETEKILNTFANKDLKKKTMIIDSLEDLVEV